MSMYWAMVEIMFFVVGPVVIVGIMLIMYKKYCNDDIEGEEEEIFYINKEDK